MPGLDLSRQIVGADFNASAEDWAHVAGSGSLNLISDIEANRGINLALGLEALLNLNAEFQRFVAAELTGDAFARAAVTAQIQVPTDIFKEAGVAARLEAAAEAAAGVSLSLGLSIGDFLELASRDERLRGLRIKLLEIFLTELSISAGVYAKAAVSAMAYAKAALTAKLTDGVAETSGFTVAGEAGAGLEAGAGFRVFAGFGVRDPRRLIRRTIDVAVDESLDRLIGLIPTEQAEGRTIVKAMRAPAKMALRAAFELGLELRGTSFDFDDAAAEKMAIRCVHVLLEEAQRFLLDSIVNLGAERFREALESAGIDQPTWDGFAGAREALAQKLLAVPEDPFEDNQENRTYWSDLVRDAASLATQLADADGEWIEWMAVLWAAGQLLMVSTKRVSQAGASVRGLGLGAREARAAFSGPLAETPNSMISAEINRSLGRPENSALTQDVLLAFLTRNCVIDEIDQRYPEVSEFLETLASQTGSSHLDTARTMLTTLGAFCSGAVGQRDPNETLRIIIAALREFLHQRIDGVVVPLVQDRAADGEGQRLYVNEVISPTLHFTVDVVLSEIANWRNLRDDRARALREACSSILMMLFGRSLVVALDVLTAAAQEQIREQMYQAADHVNDTGGLAQVLAGMLPHVEREQIAELCGETLRIAGDVFGPLPASTRNAIRTSLYECVETLPPDADAGFLDQLADICFVPSLSSVRRLSEELASLVASNFGAFVSRLLTRLAEIALEEFREFVDEMITEVQRWLAQTERALEELSAAVASLLAELGSLGQEVEVLWNTALSDAEDLLDLCASANARDRIRDGVGQTVIHEAKEVLFDNSVYDALPSWAKNAAKNALEDAVWAALDNKIVDGLMGSLGDAASELGDFAQDVRGLNPDGSLTDQIISLFLDRVEDRVRAHFGSDNPRISLSFRVSVSATVFGQTVSVDKTINLGSFSIPLSQVIGNVRSALGALSVLRSQAQSLAQNIAAALEKEINLHCAEQNYAAASDAHAEVTRILDESWARGIEVSVVTPAPGAFIDGDLEIEIMLEQVPMSFLGLGDAEQQRLFAWLNQSPLDIDRFTVKEFEFTGAAQSDSLGPDSLPGSGHARARTSIDKAERGTPRPEKEITHPWVTPTESSKLTTVRYQPGDVIDRWGRRDPAIASIIARQRAAPEQAAGKVPPRHVLAASVCSKRGSLAGKGASLSFVRPASGTSIPELGIFTGPGYVSGNEPGRAGGRTAANNPDASPSIGRSPTVTMRSRITAQANPCLILTLTIPAADLELGVNTVSVAITDGRQQRVEEAVSFLAFQQIAEATPRSPSLPKMPKIDLPKGLRPTYISVTCSATGKECAKDDGTAAHNKAEPIPSSRPGSSVKKGFRLLVPRAERGKRIANARKHVQARMGEATQAVSETLEAVRDLALAKPESGPPSQKAPPQRRGPRDRGVKR